MPHTRKEILAIGKEIANKIFHKKKVEEVTIKGLVARDKDNTLNLFKYRPAKRGRYWSLSHIGYNMGCVYELSSELFPFVQWSDPEPTPATITIKIEK